jgi:hypothetical protein
MVNMTFSRRTRTPQNFQVIGTSESLEASEELEEELEEELAVWLFEKAPAIRW